MFLIVGLGNPGIEYENTRHNMGFSVLDELMENHVGMEINKNGFKGQYLKTIYLGEDVVFLKPMTYMNLSGESVIEAVHFFKIPLENIVVVFDDMDLNPGTIRLRKSGSSGGQKGMNNIIQLLGSKDIKRIRVGIGKADNSVVDYVLSRPNGDEATLIEVAIKKASDAIVEIIKNGFDRAMNKYN